MQLRAVCGEHKWCGQAGAAGCGVCDRCLYCAFRRHAVEAGAVQGAGSRHESRPKRGRAKPTDEQRAGRKRELAAKGGRRRVQRAVEKARRLAARPEVAAEIWRLRCKQEAGRGLTRRQRERLDRAEQARMLGFDSWVMAAAADAEAKRIERKAPLTALQRAERKRLLEAQAADEAARDAVVAQRNADRNEQRRLAAAAAAAHEQQCREAEAEARERAAQWQLRRLANTTAAGARGSWAEVLAEQRVPALALQRKRRADADAAERRLKEARCATEAKRRGDGGGGGGKRRRSLGTPGGSGVAGWAPAPSLQGMMFAEATAQKRREQLKRWRDGAVGRDDPMHSSKHARV